MKNTLVEKLNRFSLWIFLILALAVCSAQVLRAESDPSLSPDTKALIVKLKGSDELLRFKFAISADLSEIIAAYKKNSAVEIAEKLTVYKMAVEPLDTYYTQQTYLSQIQANRAWNIARESPEIVIAVLDTGVDIYHPDLAENIWRNENELPSNGLDDDHNGYIDDINGWDFTQDSPDVRPKFESGFSKIAMLHGTVVAGVAAAQGGNDVGVAGVTWRAKIMPLRVLRADGVGDTIAVARAINYARDNGADIINLSFVGEDYSQTLALAIEQAYNAGVLIVAAAGNEVLSGVNTDTAARYPVCHDGDLGANQVVGVTSVDGNDRKASFSNYGRCIDLAAPGVRIFSTQYVTTLESGFDNQYGGGWTGTSVSAPQVAGVAALIKALQPDITLRELQEFLLNNTDDISNLNPGLNLGSGRLNAFKVLQAVLQRSHLAQAKASPVVATGAGPGGGPHVRVFDSVGAVQAQFFAAPASFKGGINVALADFDNDGQTEVIVAPESDSAPWLRIFSLSGILQKEWLAYAANFRSGFKLAIGDVDGDGQPEIITAPNQGGGPHIRIFNHDGALESQFFAYPSGFRGGVNLSSSDIDGDKRSEIITAPGPGAVAQVKIFDNSGFLVNQWLAFDNSFFNGVTIAAADGYIAVAAGQGAPPRIRLYDKTGNFIREWLAYAPGFFGSVNIVLADLNNDNSLEVLILAGRGGGPHLRIFDTQGKVIQQWMAYNPAFRGGAAINVQK